MYTLNPVENNYGDCPTDHKKCSPDYYNNSMLHVHV